MAQLPSTHIEDKLIGSMLVGESGYVVPWCMWTDFYSECFLNESYTYHHKKGGTVCMKIKRVPDGYVVDLSGVEHRWVPQEKPSFVGQDEMAFGRVVEFSEIATPIKTQKPLDNPRDTLYTKLKGIFKISLN